MTANDAAETAGCLGVCAAVVGGIIFGGALGLSKCSKDNKKFSWDNIKKTSFCLVNEDNDNKLLLVENDDKNGYKDIINEKFIDVNDILEYHNTENYIIKNELIKSEYNKDDLRSILEKIQEENDNYIYSDETVTYTWNCVKNSYVGLVNNNSNNEEKTITLLRSNDDSYDDLINGKSIKENEITNLRKAESYFTSSNNVKDEYSRDDLENIISQIELDGDNLVYSDDNTTFTWDNIKNSYVGLLNNDGEAVKSLLSINNEQYFDMLNNKEIKKEDIVEINSAVPYFVQTDNVKVEYTKKELKTIVSEFKVESVQYTTEDSHVKVKK